MAQFFNDILHRLISSVGHDSWIGYALAAGVHLFLLINVVAVGALVFIWMERKIAGRIQDRLGPTRVGGKFGWLQTLADGVKLVAKEDITPNQNVEISFALLTLPRIWVKGTTTWRKPQSKTFGVRFESGDERRLKIKSWVESYLEC